MTTTARIAAKTAADTYSANIAPGAVGNFIAHDLVQANNEEVAILASNAAGTYKPFTFIDEGGKERTASLTAVHNSIQLIGPIDFQFSKPITQEPVELSEFS